MNSKGKRSSAAYAFVESEKKNDNLDLKLQSKRIKVLSFSTLTTSLCLKHKATIREGARWSLFRPITQSARRAASTLRAPSSINTARRLPPASTPRGRTTTWQMCAPGGLRCGYRRAATMFRLNLRRHQPASLNERARYRISRTNSNTCACETRERPGQNYP